MHEGNGTHPALITGEVARTEQTPAADSHTAHRQNRTHAATSAGDSATGPVAGVQEAEAFEIARPSPAPTDGDPDATIACDATHPPRSPSTN